MTQIRPYRVLITGSRDWTDLRTVKRALYIVAGGVDVRLYNQMLFVHGDCQTGADAMVNSIINDMQDMLLFGGGEPALFGLERHPADWSKGPSAGPTRNKHMVSLGAHHCLAFVGPCTSPRCQNPDAHDSHGASGTAALALGAGIPTTIYRPQIQSADDEW